MSPAIGDRLTSLEIAAEHGVDIGNGSGGAGQWGVWHLPGKLVLRVTLDHRGRKAEHRYLDRFESPETLSWQSQPKVNPGTKRGQDYIKQRERGLETHLFARGPKYAKGKTLPFVYLGTAEQIGWSGANPMTVRWRLSTPVPPDLWPMLSIPPPRTQEDLMDFRAPTALDAETVALLPSVAAGVAKGDFGAADEWTTAKKRAGQAVFRSAVLDLFSNRCAICGLADPRLLDAAHIVSWSRDSSNRLNPHNGIALCALHHRAMDCGIIGIEADGNIVVKMAGLDVAEARQQFGRFQGLKIQGPLERIIPFLARSARDGTPNPAQ